VASELLVVKVPFFLGEGLARRYKFLVLIFLGSFDTIKRKMSKTNFSLMMPLI